MRVGDACCRVVSCRVVSCHVDDGNSDGNSRADGLRRWTRLPAVPLHRCPRRSSEHVLLRRRWLVVTPRACRQRRCPTSASSSSLRRTCHKRLGVRTGSSPLKWAGEMRGMQAVLSRMHPFIGCPCQYICIILLEGATQSRTRRRVSTHLTAAQQRSEKNAYAGQAMRRPALA